MINRFAFLKNELINYSTNNSLIGMTNRGDLALFGFSQLKNFLLFGYGAGSFELLFKNFYLNTSINYANHAHFDLVEFTGEFGIIGMLLLLFIVFNCFTKIKFNNLKNLYLLYFLLLILFFDFSFHIFLIQVTFLIMLSINLKNINQ